MKQEKWGGDKYCVIKTKGSECIESAGYLEML